VEKGASIWPMAVLRASNAQIRIGRGAAVLDLALLEAPEGHPVLVEEEALISHGAIIHGARVQSRALVGIGAIVLDGAVISSGSIIGAGSVIPPGTKIPPNSLAWVSRGRWFGRLPLRNGRTSWSNSPNCMRNRGGSFPLSPDLTP